LIKSINEKDEVLKCQEDLLVKVNKKLVKLKDAFGLKVEKCKNLTKELKTRNDSISCLKSKNASLIAKIEKLNAYHVLHLPLSMLLFALDVEMLKLML
jgi:chromosome segregation ATPase